MYWATAVKSEYSLPIKGVVIFPNSVSDIGQLQTDFFNIGALTLSPTDSEPPASSILVNSNNVPMLQLNLSADSNAETVNVQQITVTLMPSSTGALSAITTASLLLDTTGDNTFATSEGTAAISGNAVTFSGFSVPVGTNAIGNNKWEVVFTFNGTATTGQTFILEIANKLQCYFGRPNYRTSCYNNQPE